MYRSVLALEPSWLSSSQAWKNRPRGVWYTPSHTVVNPVSTFNSCSWGQFTPRLKGRFLQQYQQKGESKLDCFAERKQRRRERWGEREECAGWVTHREITRDQRNPRPWTAGQKTTSLQSNSTVYCAWCWTSHRNFRLSKTSNISMYPSIYLSK